LNYHLKNHFDLLKRHIKNKIMTNKIASTNPSLNFELIGEVEIDTEESIKEKIRQARIAQEKWVNETLETRIVLLKSIYTIMIEKKENLAQSISLEMGMAIRDARDEVQYGLNYFLWYLENAQKYLNPEITFENETETHRVYYEPKGVVIAIAPWNYPSFMFVWTCIQALLA
jgi:succinate-semialdehyde dehydrogenase / glutarate-semialdehyde dehydrogenase